MNTTAVLKNEGEIKIPMEILKKLGVQDGDKVYFAEQEGQIIISSSNIFIWNELRNSMEGAAQEAGFKDEDEVVDYCREIRRKKWKQLYENNA